MMATETESSCNGPRQTMKEPTSPSRQAGPWSIPNLLTYARILVVPLVVLCFDLEERGKSTDAARWWALGLFVFASVTDFLDGYLARIWQQTSSLGKMLDPIADKLLVAACLLLLAADGAIAGWSIWAAVVILSREILVSGLREYLADLKVSVPVTQLAKWKTALQMISLGFLLAGPAGDKVLATVSNNPQLCTDIGLALLWIAAGVTLITGWDYFRAGLKHMVEE